MLEHLEVPRCKGVVLNKYIYKYIYIIPGKTNCICKLGVGSYCCFNCLFFFVSNNDRITLPFAFKLFRSTAEISFLCFLLTVHTL